MSELAPLLLGSIPPLACWLAAAVAWLHRGRLATRRASTATAAATYIALGCSLIAAAWVALHGSATSPLLGVDGVGWSIRLDPLSAVLFPLIAFIGVIVVRFSSQYLAGDPRQAAFAGWLCATLSAVLSLVLAGNLTHLTAAWIGTSLALHRLLLFYPGRPRAQTAARKKFWVARVADACLVGAVMLLSGHFDTTDIGELATAARALPRAGETPEAVAGAAWLLCVAALLKSAQFPTHGWLTEVMETPTPVSALLHAGIINAGGFLVMRLAAVVLTTPPAMTLMAGVGALTALYGSAVMLTQPAVKTALAYSTIGQMGFMLLECGLGAWSLALLHLVAHSLYKAHAFLSAGNAVAAAHGAWLASPSSTPRAGLSSRVGGLGLLCIACSTPWLLVGRPGDAATIALGAIVAMGAVSLGARVFGRLSGWRGMVAGVASASMVVGVYWLSKTLAAGVTGTLFPPPPPPSATKLTVVALTIASFASLAWMQLRLAEGATPRWLARTYVHLRHGLYANVLFDRTVGAHRLPRAATTTATETPS